MESSSKVHIPSKLSLFFRLISSVQRRITSWLKLLDSTLGCSRILACMQASTRVLVSSTKASGVPQFKPEARLRRPEAGDLGTPRSRWLLLGLGGSSGPGADISATSASCWWWWWQRIEVWAMARCTCTESPEETLRVLALQRPRKQQRRVSHMIYMTSPSVLSLLFLPRT